MVFRRHWSLGARFLLLDRSIDRSQRAHAQVPPPQQRRFNATVPVFASPKHFRAMKSNTAHAMLDTDPFSLFRRTLISDDGGIANTGHVFFRTAFVLLPTLVHSTQGDQCMLRVVAMAPPRGEEGGECDPPVLLVWHRQQQREQQQAHHHPQEDDGISAAQLHRPCSWRSWLCC